MAWNTESQKLVAKAIAKVESDMRYDAINYRDPITVGAFQWYGARAASVLNRMRTENASAWTGVAASIHNDLVNRAPGTWWSGRYLTQAEGTSLRPVLFNNQPIQNNQAIDDFEAYKDAYTRNGGDAEGNTQAMLFFMVMWHQGPARTLEVLRAAGPSSNIDRLYAFVLNNRVLGQYKTRYTTARDIIKSGDSSGIDLGGNVGTPTDPDYEPGEPDPSGQGEDRPRNLSGASYIKRVGQNMHIIHADGHTVIAAPAGNDTWSISGDSTVGAPVPPAPPVEIDPPPDPPDPPPGGSNPGTLALAWMIANQEKWAYGQGAGRDNPWVSGYTDCSACVRLAYRKTSGIDPGGYTTPQSQFGTLITTNREQIRAGTGLLPGDLIFYRAYVRAGWPYNHVEMYTGDAQRRTIGQVGSTAPGPSLHPMNRYLDYGSLAVMARRPW